jgi:CubicO group peptidase (beta-lactamase class C family)
VRQNVLFPIGMEHTEIDVAATHPRLAQGYGPRVGGERSPVGNYSANAATPACGLTSTIRDMEKFLTWQFRVRSGTNDEVLTRRSLREMQRPHRLSDDMQFGQGLGFWNSKHQASWLVGHAGEMPGFWTCIMIDPDTQLGVVLLANSMYAPVHLGQSESLMDGMFAASKMIDQAPSSDRTDNSKHPEAIRYEGTYRSIWGDLCVRRVNGKLLVFDPNGLNPFSRRYILEPLEIANHRFVAVESTDNYYLQESFVFEDFVDGTAMVLRDPGAEFQRIGQ